MENGAMKPYDGDRERGRRSGGPRSLFEHFERSLSRPFDSWGSFPEFNALWDEGPMRSLCQDVHAVAGTKVDWKETKDAHIFKADLPGLSKEDVKVTIEDGQLLRISGERSREKEDRTDTWHRVERSHGRFLRQFRLPDDANTEQVQAKAENGVLSVTVPKLQTTENPRHRNIQIE